MRLVIDGFGRIWVIEYRRTGHPEPTLVLEAPPSEASVQRAAVERKWTQERNYEDAE